MVPWRAMFLDAIARLTSAQHGLVTTQQILATGATRAWIRWAVEDGRLTPVRRGVYAAVGAPASPYASLAAAGLAAGPGVAASHLPAGWLWGAADVARALPELTAFDGRQVRLRGVRVHRSALESERWVTDRHNIPTVVAPLMIVQLAEAASCELAIAVARDLRKRNLVGYRLVLECLDATRIKVKPALARYCDRALRVDGHDDSPRRTRWASRCSMPACHSLRRSTRSSSMAGSFTSISLGPTTWSASSTWARQTTEWTKSTATPVAAANSPLPVGAS